MSGLSVNPLSYYSSYYPQKNATTVQSAYQNLGTALQSGNLSSAQVAFAALQQANQGQNQGGTSGPIATDMTNLGNALNSSNLSSAQSAYAQLQKDVDAQVGHDHHHGGGIGGAIQALMSQLLPSSATSTTASTSTGATTTPATSNASGTLNVLA